MILNNMSGVYIHIPFCRNKCLYCDFYTAGSRIADWNLYINCVLNELTFRKNEIKETPQTLYIGGGTPSLIPNDEFKRLVNELQRILGVNKWEEFTIEVNPEDIDIEKLECWADTRVNRVSMGIQSLNNKELLKIGRKHDSLQALQSMAKIKEYFNNISVDVMFGLPGQTIETYSRTLQNIIELKPTHVSSYSLMLETGTAMTFLTKNGEIDLPDEDLWMQMSDLTSELLIASGYQRYEISNYSLKGYESIHNRNYWKGEPYIGLGPAAHSYDGGRIRRANPNQLKQYFYRYKSLDFSSSKEPFFQKEILTDKELREEFILTRLRMLSGIDIKEFESRFGYQQKENLLSKANSFIKSGLLKEDIENGRIFLSPQGMKVSDYVMSSLF